MFKNDNASEAFLEKHLNLICEKSYIYLRRWFIHFFSLKLIEKITIFKNICL
jgi:hypothetical protein